MNIPLDEVVHFDGVANGTSNTVDADSTPTFAVYEESTDTDIGVGGNMTKRTSLTGHYRGSFTASAANGFEVGKWYAVYGTAVIGGETRVGLLKTFRVVAAETVAGVPKVDLTHINGTVASGTTTMDSNVVTIANNAITAAAIAADAVTEMQGGLATATALATVAGYIDTEIAAIAADATLTRQIVGNKHTVVESPAGTFTISVRNDDDTATVRTIVYIPATGARTVS